MLKEVLIKIQDQNVDASDTKNETPEEISIYILSILRILHYQPQTDPVTFRQESLSFIWTKFFNPTVLFATSSIFF